MDASVETLLAEAMPRGYVAAYRWLGNRDESRDACQEAAARALGAAERYDPSKPFYPWFYRILRNHCMDRLKGRGHAARAAGQLRHVDDRSRQDSAEARLLSREREAAVARAIEQLGAESREVIELRHFQDLPYQQMAELLGCPLGTVMSRLFRARKALRRLLQQDPDWNGRFAGPSTRSKP